MNTLTIIRPDDWHLHLRDGKAMASVVAASARRFGRAIVMPNLQPPVTTVAQALAYRERILACRPAGSSFAPLMTLYLTDDTDADELRRAADSEHVHGVKLYPAGATTHSDNGVTDVTRIYPLLEVLRATDLPLLVHGEVTDPAIDIFDREAAFIDRVLAPLVREFTGLRVVFEHLSSASAVDFVAGGPATLGATITPQHLLYDRNQLLAGGLRPHYYCLPVLKAETDRQALVKAATGGNPRFFLGTDSAPHERARKEDGCGCAGCYSAAAGIELYAQVFDAAGALHRLEAFASRHGADFYRLPRNTDTITLERRDWHIPDSYPFDDGSVVPLAAGTLCAWQLNNA